MRGPLLLDTNLLVLLVTGMTNPEYIHRHKRLAAYDLGDFRIVEGFTKDAGNLVFSPNVLTETSNMLRYAHSWVRAELSATLAELVARFGEQYVETEVAIAHQHHLRLGVADCVLLTQADAGATLLTDDLDLYLASAGSGHKAYNYNHIRELRPDFR